MAKELLRTITVCEIGFWVGTLWKLVCYIYWWKLPDVSLIWSRPMVAILLPCAFLTEDNLPKISGSAADSGVTCLLCGGSFYVYSIGMQNWCDGGKIFWTSSFAHNTYFNWPFISSFAQHDCELSVNFLKKIRTIGQLLLKWLLPWTSPHWLLNWLGHDQLFYSNLNRPLWP